MECYCYFRDIQDLGKNSLRKLNAGDGWTGELLVADVKELKDNCIRSQRQKFQRKRSGNSKSRRTIHISTC